MDFIGEKLGYNLFQCRFCNLNNYQIGTKINILMSKSSIKFCESRFCGFLNIPSSMVMFPLLLFVPQPFFQWLQLGIGIDYQF